MSLLKSLSILILFVASIILTYYYTKQNVKVDQNITYRFVPRTFETDYNNIPLPSMVFKDMFDLPSAWMNQAEKDSREAQGKLLKERELLNEKNKNKIEKERKREEINQILGTNNNKKDKPKKSSKSDKPKKSSKSDKPKKSSKSDKPKKSSKSDKPKKIEKFGDTKKELNTKLFVMTLTKPNEYDDVLPINLFK
jgi:hypothetical protein